MAHLNSKTILQEWCHIQGFSLPIYDTKLVSTNNNIISFTSTVIVDTYTIGGEIASSKKNAELFAAKNALDQLVNSEKDQNIFKSQRDENIFIAVDLENVNCLNQIKKSVFDPSITLMLFKSKLYPIKKSGFTANYMWFEIDSCIKDAVDIAIVGKTVELLIKGASNIIILSRDHFAGALCDCVNQGLFNDIKGKVKHITSYENLIEELKNES